MSKIFQFSECDKSF